MVTWEEDAFWLRDMIKEIHEEKAYEHFFQAKKDDVIVDVGANIGIFTLKVSKIVGERGKVIAFEPQRNNYKLLIRNLGINKCKNVVPINQALCDFNGKATFYVKSVSLHNTLQPQANSETPTTSINIIGVRKLSSVLDNLNIDHVSFLKIDAEGSELEVLKGAEELLLTHQVRNIAVATYHSTEETQMIMEYLQKFGYAVHLNKNIGLANFQRIHVFGSYRSKNAN